jgi:Uma2 family endonuclease
MSGDREQPIELAAAVSLRASAPLCFPVEETVPETKRHLELRTLLYQVLKLSFADRAAIGCDQFVYWDPTDPRACLAPDAFVRFGEADHLFRSWKVWERGAPQVAVEIISDADERDRDWQAKLEKYRRLGVTELVRFDPESIDQPLQIWDFFEGTLVERDLALPAGAQSRCLPGFWLTVQQSGIGLALRLSHDEEGERLYPNPAEQEAEARRVESAAHLAAESRARDAAERRIRELEEQLRR